MEILTKIKQMRKKYHNLIQKDMADILGYKTAKAYHDIECGRIKLKLEHLEKLSSKFNIPLEKFFTYYVTKMVIYSIMYLI